MKTKLTFLNILGLLFAGIQLPCAYAAPCCASNPIEALDRASLPDRSLYFLESDWSNQEGEVVKLQAFQGKPVIVAMIFTHCEYACPQIIGDMLSLKSQLGPQYANTFHYLLVSMDSERDKPEVLKVFAQQRQLNTDEWTLLHGNKDGVEEIAAVLGVKFRKDKNAGFAHSNVITLLSNEGEITYQHLGLNTDLDLLIQACEALANEKINN